MCEKKEVTQKPPNYTSFEAMTDDDLVVYYGDYHEEDYINYSDDYQDVDEDMEGYNDTRSSI